MRSFQLCATAAAIAIGAIAIPAVSDAQCTANGAPASCNQSGSVSMTAGRVVRLQMSAASTPLTAPTPADFDAGFNATTGPTFTVSANAPWTLHLRASTAVWTASNTSADAPARTNKPAGDLRWSTASNGAFGALTTSDVNLVTGAATASSATTLYFQTLYNWTLDTPGNYGLTVVLTLTSP
jgi:hypothetical protein